MTQDPAVLGYLGRALSLELSAVQQYLSLTKLFELRGMPQAAEQFRHEAQEEMKHAELIIGRMLALGVAPNASHLRPVHLDGTLSQLMEYVSQMEAQIIDFYTRAVHDCSRLQDHESRFFFEKLLHEEQQHATGLKHWRHEIENGQPADSK